MPESVNSSLLILLGFLQNAIHNYANVFISKTSFGQFVLLSKTFVFQIKISSFIMHLKKTARQTPCCLSLMHEDAPCDIHPSIDALLHGYKSG